MVRLGSDLGSEQQPLARTPAVAIIESTCGDLTKTIKESIIHMGNNSLALYYADNI
jgi:hypothetical protein